MKIALGADHRGTTVARSLLAHLKALGHEVDASICDGESCDYPDKAYYAAKRVSDGRADRGIVICSNGVGVCMAANKVRGVRAALVHDSVNAEQSRRHNDANVLCLGSETISAKELLQLTELWLDAPFEGGRHERRVRKIEAIERGEDPATITNGEPAAAKAR
jgi:ribose 5-phosphate isomerase B